MNLNHISVYTSKVQETVEFYRTLGLRLMVDSLPNYARFECPNGDATLSLMPAPVTTEPSDTILYFECEDVDAEVSRLREAGIPIDAEPADMPWLWRQALVLDPIGSKICLYHAGENRKNPPWRVE